MFQGNVYFAVVYSFDDLVPNYEGTQNAVLIPHLRGRETIDATTIEWFEKVVSKLEAAGNKLMLSGVETGVYERLKRTEAYELIGEDNIFMTQPLIGASIDAALDKAERWIADRKAQGKTIDEDKGTVQGEGGES